MSEQTDIRSVAVYGGGSWGTAFAVLCAHRGVRVRLVCHTAAQAATVARDRVNPAYLPGVRLPDAIDVVMALRPSALEGRRMRFARHAWAVHNLVGHPLLQVLVWLGARRLGMAVHEGTVPRARG